MSRRATFYFTSENEWMVEEISKIASQTGFNKSSVIKALLLPSLVFLRSNPDVVDDLYTIKHVSKLADSFIRGSKAAMAEILEGLEDEHAK